MICGRIGLDIGSTTIKIVVLDDGGEVVFKAYERHNARVPEVLSALFGELENRFGDTPFRVTVTGSVGLGVAERSRAEFVQEVVALMAYTTKCHPEVSTIIDIGGEDAKEVLLGDGVPDMRMNGNCAGGTGAFIDQMALLLNTTAEGLNTLAANAANIHPTASRCGVFAKTDVQNLISRNVSREEIAASVFHAVVVQTAVTLSHGCEIKPPVLFCGGPLTFLPSLRKAFADYLGLTQEQMVVPAESHLLSAWGAALSGKDSRCATAAEWRQSLSGNGREPLRTYDGLEQIFKSDDERRKWRESRLSRVPASAPIPSGEAKLWLGIDSGSTTTKIIAIDDKRRMLFSFYAPNDGNPTGAVERGLRQLSEECRKAGAEPVIMGGCSTGYGEDLIKAAFGLDSGVIETIAHYMAAREVAPEVSFILDIGGQDMKAIFIEHGVVTRMELNEACSSGCGSFIETFAKSLGYTVSEFADLACTAEHPCDLGTRCTVFMNSKVKQMLREGASVADIAAGLSYSVVKNCLYKVLKLKSTEKMGGCLAVQGGTMRNDAVVRAFEKLVGRDVFRSERPELMGAYGCALYAAGHEPKPRSLEEMIHGASFSTREIRCGGCENNCRITKYRFAGRDYYSGNKCERHFSNRGGNEYRGSNAYAEKLRLLFNRPERKEAALTVGIPRVLNLYEEYPFWHTLFYNCGIRVVLSDASNMETYERSACKVMSDNICFPAKLVHAHIDNLIAKGVDRIFMPYVIYEQAEESNAANSYNCPIVTGYSDVVKSAGRIPVPFDTPAISFKNMSRLYRQCRNYLVSIGVPRNDTGNAFRRALYEQERFLAGIRRVDEEILLKSRESGRTTMLLAGRPYHSDPLIQHKISETIADLGVDVITEDIVRDKEIQADDAHFVNQWAYPNRILKAAKWAAQQPDDLQFIEMTSFGCGPDALLTDEVRDLLGRYGKSLTLLKIDDVNNIGSLKLRVRSTIESLKLERPSRTEPQPFISTPIFTRHDRGRKILFPFFTPFISPLIPAIVERAGYDSVCLPVSSAESVDTGLKYANNEICYPATLVVGDIITALRSGKYDPSKTAVAISQTGGQCRASNYISLIKRALVEAGYSNVPVISIAPGRGIKNKQPGFRVRWTKILPCIIGSVVFSDCLSRLYHASVVRETSEGEAATLRDWYLNEALNVIRNVPGKRQIEHFIDLTALAAEDFARISDNSAERPKVGIVGEIYLKFNPFAHKGLTEYLIHQGVEVVPPALTDFFMQDFVNREVRNRTGIEASKIPDGIVRHVAGRIQRIIDNFNSAASHHGRFMPIGNVYREAEAASEIVSLNAQFGEGWLLPGEIATFAREGINNAISLQPFGCIANHVISKGIERRIKTLYPQMNLLSLDFDGSVSDVNITNRLLLFLNNIK